MTNRLTKKVENEERYIANNFKREHGERLLTAIDNYNAKVYNKLGRIEDLEEQIGCPLEVVFKALTNGFKFIISSHKLGTQNQRVNQMIYCDYAYLYYANDVKEWCISTINDYFYLKDYKKTWWLKEDKSE